jgi:outer membrane protein OmpA-like peptidoglycan-associated protein
MAYRTQTWLCSVSSVAIACAPLLGCATAQPPKELLDARAAYTRAESGYANQLSPADLHSAKVALDDAERTFKDDGPSKRARDQAYVAIRKAQLAEADGATEHIKREISAAKERDQTAQAQAAERSRQQLQQAKQQLTQEEQARKEAQQRAEQAMQKLKAANAAAVKQEPNRTVITLPGNVLFASGQATLMPGAQTSLNEVAEALKQQNNANIRVEGHTDSTGSESVNLALSKERAAAVSSYLVDQGVPHDRITTEGLGSSGPIGDNSTAAGRAMNRRVDIVVEPQEPH